MGNVILHPAKAAELICHDDQMVIWTGEMAGALNLAGFIREDMEYHDVVDLHEVIKQELLRIVKSAITHPEAATIRRPARQ